MMLDGRALDLAAKEMWSEGILIAVTLTEAQLILTISGRDFLK